ncbi:MAG: response regulator [Actinomycetes bacterium]|nr:response regulator [Actinomycetes bacterium]MDX5381123.1 response regulator [Actinomycetes bacterium]MDX5400358.1 response regulator [Actinomycetes bacterium]MDX5450879.1 response regulator [Actinomycetes bacterium]
MDDSSPPLRVLVVDDSRVIRELIAVNLAHEGFEVTTAADGQAAVDLATELHPDVVTLDVMMPRLNGFEAVQRLRQDPRTATIPVVMVTGRAQSADLDRGREVGVEAYLTKPFEPTDLVEVVTRLAREARGRSAP